MKDLTALALCAGLSLNASALVLTPGDFDVVVGPGAPKAVEFAAEELTNFLSRALGAAIPVVERPTSGRIAIVLGTNGLSNAAGLAPWKLPRDASEIRVTRDRIYIAGLDDPAFDMLARMHAGSGSDDHECGTVHGVYEFLERFAGCRFYFPGELGEIVPKASRITVPEGGFTDKPDYSVRYYSDWRHDDAWYDESLPPADIARGHRLEARRLRMKTEEIPCCHGQYQSKFVQRFGETHPEYFIMNADGKREIRDTEEVPYCENAQMCHTSGIWDEIYRDARSYFLGEGPEVRGMLMGKGRYRRPGWSWQAKYGKYYDVMPQDGMRQCRCPKCQAAYAKDDPTNYASELIWGQTVRVAKRLKAEGIRGTITQMAYPPHRSVPSMDIPDNVAVMVAERGPWSYGDRRQLESERAEIRAWAKKTGGNVWIWTYVGKFGKSKALVDVPLCAPRSWGHYYASLSDCIFGAYAESETDRFLHHYLDYYVFSKVCWNNRTDVEALIQEHNVLMFGAGAKPMDEFFRILERKWVKEVAANTIDTTVGPVMSPPNDHDLWTRIYSEKVMARLGDCLAAAIRAVPRGSLEARRIALMKAEFYDRIARKGKAYRDMVSVGKWKAYNAAHPELKPATTWRIDTWGGKKGTLELEEGGRRVHFIPDPVKNDIDVYHFFDEAKPGRRYRVSWFMKFKDVGPCVLPNGKLPYSSGLYATVHPSPVWKDLVRVPEKTRFSGTMDWIHQSVDVKLSDDPNTHLRLSFRMPATVGEVWVEDATVEEISQF